MRAEYDIRGGVRGKYYERYRQGTTVVLLGATKVITRDEVPTILDSGNFNDLIRAVENEWLECKAAPYRLKEDHQKQELAKDVCALANASGGFILIGLKTQRDPTHFGDEIIEVRPYPQSLVNSGQYQDVLKQWIYPRLQQVEVKWFPSASDPKKGIFAILIPPQASIHRPFLLTRTLDAKGKHVEVVFGYVERHRAGVDPMSVQELHGLIKDGFRFETLDQRIENIQATLVEMRLLQPDMKLASSTQDSSKLLGERVAEAVIEADLGGKRSFSLAAIPTNTVEIQSLFERRDADVVRLLENPPELRQGGFDLAADASARIVRGQLRRAVTPRYKTLELWRDGTLVFGAAGDENFLSWGRHSVTAGPIRINPLVLIESTFLFVELSRLIYQHVTPQPSSVVYRLELQNMTLEGKPSVLIPGPVGSFAWEFGTGTRSPAPTPNFIYTITWNEPSIKSGEIAFQLVREVYRWFGLEDNNIPYKEQVDGQFAISPEQIVKVRS